MANNLYTTKTAALKATKADINNLNVKKLFLGGENILDIIKRATPTIKHSQDTRETVTENDLWGQYIETKSDGTIIVHNDLITNPNGSSAWNTSIAKVEDNKAYVNGKLYGNILTEKIKNGVSMFYGCSKLTSFTSNLSSLNVGDSMFYRCSNLASFNIDLPSLTNGGSMFYGCSKLTSFTSNLSSLNVGDSMFASCSKLTSFTSNLSSLNVGDSMFASCTNLTSFSSDLSSLTTGSKMFNSCTNLTSFSSDLSSLTSGDSMFASCTNLTSFSSDLSSLTTGSWMFQNCSKLTSFTSNLSSLTTGGSMFYGCSKLNSFSSDLPNLTNGYNMFNSCTNLNSFSSDLSSLTSGGSMFRLCSLDAESVMYIADTIKDITAEKQLYINGTIPYITLSNGVYSAPQGFMSDGRYVYTYNDPNPTTTTIFASNVGILTLGINVSNNADTIQQQLEDFAKAATFESWADLKTHFSNKGWTVTFQYGGTTDTIPDEFPNTYDLRNREQIIPCPIFAKLVEADKDSAQYCTEDASSFYNIEWGHDVTDTTDYTQFNSLEDAMAFWNVFPKENIITTEEEA